jgi:hypothetical protein
MVWSRAVSWCHSLRLLCRSCEFFKRKILINFKIHLLKFSIRFNPDRPYVFITKALINDAGWPVYMALRFNDFVSRMLRLKLNIFNYLFFSLFIFMFEQPFQPWIARKPPAPPLRHRLSWVAKRTSSDNDYAKHPRTTSS